MLKKSFKLALIFSILSFITVSFSNAYSAEFLREVVNTSGYYIGKITEKEWVIFSFDTEDVLKTSVISYDINDNNEKIEATQVDAYYQMSGVIHLKDTNYYRIKRELISYRMTFYKDDAVSSANVHQLYGFSDWQKGVPKELVDGVQDDDKNVSVIGSLMIAISKDKKTITITKRNEAESKTLTLVHVSGNL